MPDPRYSLGKPCPIARQNDNNLTSDRKGFLDAARTIGGLEGLGPIGTGMRSLTKVSDMFRTGTSVVPGREGDPIASNAFNQMAGTALDDVNTGGNTVLDTVGLGGAVQTVSSLDPNVANRAVNSAQGIFQKVKGGNLSIDDVPYLVSDFNNLSTLFNSATGGQPPRPPNKDFDLCGASPYAMDLIKLAPKHNFMFIVDFQFTPGYSEWTDITNTMAFVVKRSNRPNVQFEYEDINMYNFRTKVPTKTMYDPMTMAFYDDNQNAAHLFYTAYMRAMSPIANMRNGFYDEDGMNFDQKAPRKTFAAGDPGLQSYAASVGSLIGNEKSILGRVRLYHVYDSGKYMNIYNFYNPRITTFSPSDLNMAETGDGAEFEFQFAYDGLFIDATQSVEEGLKSGGTNITELTDNRGAASFPIKPVFEVGDGGNNKPKLSPTAQQQEEPIAGFVSDFGKQSRNFTSGVTGAINDGWGAISSGAGEFISGAGNLISDSLRSADNFVTGGEDGDRRTTPQDEDDGNL